MANRSKILGAKSLSTRGDMMKVKQYTYVEITIEDLHLAQVNNESLKSAVMGALMCPNSIDLIEDVKAQHPQFDTGPLPQWHIGSIQIREMRHEQLDDRTYSVDVDLFIGLFQAPK